MEYKELSNLYLDLSEEILKDINFDNSILVLQGAGDIKDIMSTLKRKHDR